MERKSWCPRIRRDCGTWQKSAGLADEKHDPRSPQHVHVEPALNSADAESVPMEFLLKLDW
jgi:hypothetical protein